MQRLSFHNEILKNKRSSYLLIGAVLIILLALIYTIGFAFGGDFFFIIIIAGTIISILYVVGGYYKSADLAIAASNAKPARGEQYRQYHNLVEGFLLFFEAVTFYRGF